MKCTLEYLQKAESGWEWKNWFSVESITLVCRQLSILQMLSFVDVFPVRKFDDIARRDLQFLFVMRTPIQKFPGLISAYEGNMMYQHVVVSLF